LIGIAAFFGAGVDGGGDVVVGRTGGDGAVGIGGGAVERGVDHGVGAAGDGAAVDVVADGFGGGIPGEVDGVLSLSCAGAGQRLHGGGVRGVAAEGERSGGGSAGLGREGYGEG